MKWSFGYWVHSLWGFRSPLKLLHCIETIPNQYASLGSSRHWHYRLPFVVAFETLEKQWEPLKFWQGIYLWLTFCSLRLLANCKHPTNSELLGIDHVGHHSWPTPGHLETFPAWQSGRLTRCHETIGYSHIRFDCSSPSPSWSFLPKRCRLLRHATWLLHHIDLSPTLRIRNRQLPSLPLSVISWSALGRFPPLWRIIPKHQSHCLCRPPCSIDNLPFPFHARNELHNLLWRRLPLSYMDDAEYGFCCKSLRQRHYNGPVSIEIYPSGLQDLPDTWAWKNGFVYVQDGTESARWRRPFHLFQLSYKRHPCIWQGCFMGAASLTTHDP